MRKISLLIAFLIAIVTIVCCYGINASTGYYAADGQTAYRVYIFSISSKVYWEESAIWGYSGHKWENEWLCSNLFIRKSERNLLVFADKWMDENAMPSKKICQWHSDIFENCRKEFTVGSMIGLNKIDSYEPKREYNQKLLLKVIKALAEEECALFKEATYHLIFFTNFAEKSLAINLPAILENNQGHIFDIKIAPLTIAAANYYYRAINHSEPFYYFIDRFLNEQNSFLENLNKNWHQIYLLGLSTNLTTEQYDKIIESAKLPIDFYFSPENVNRTEPISFMIIGKQPIFVPIPVPVYNFCENTHYAIEECYKNFRLSKEMDINTELIDHNFEYILEMMEKAVHTYYGKIYGAQLPPEQMADAIIHKQIQPKPRIVLITDYVEMKFLNSKLPIENGFEFKVYALNKVVAEHFQGRADVVIQIDPDNPPIIPFTREEEEFSYPKPATVVPQKETTIVRQKEKANLFIIVSIVFGTTFGMLILLISTIVYRRRLQRVNWLHRLEKFKTQHLFDAYINETRKSQKEKADLWEIGWNQILLTNEQLGQGAFGEVRKATFASSSAAEYGIILDKNDQSEFKVAVKMLPIYASEKAQKNFLQEMKIMKLLGNGHHCVVKMLGCMSKGEGALGIVLEFCARGSLLEHLNKSKMAEGEERQKLCRPFSRWAWQIADGMVFLAGKNLVHRDLAARNVLLDENSIAKISDFGLCISLDEKLAKESDEIIREKLPIFLLAPECLERREFSEKSDIWAFGLLLHEIYTLGINPFASIEFHKLIEYIREYRPKRPEMCPKLIFEIMQKCLLFDFVERPTFIEIREKLRRMLEKETVAYGYMDLQC